MFCQHFAPRDVCSVAQPASERIAGHAERGFKTSVWITDIRDAVSIRGLKPVLAGASRHAPPDTERRRGSFSIDRQHHVTIVYLAFRSEHEPHKAALGRGSLPRIP